MKQYTFTFSPFVTGVSVTLAFVMCAASVWQWQRYEFKKELQAKYATHSVGESEPLDANALLARAETLLFEKVSLHGRFDFSKEFVVINRSNGRQPGFWLVTPFLLEGSEHALLVSRGFIPFEDNEPEEWQRYSFPAPNAQDAQGALERIEVVLQDGRAQRSWFAPAFPPSERDASFKRKWAYVDIESLAPQYPYPLVAGVYAQQLKPRATEGFPEEYIHLGLPPSTHFWYSIEWILLACSVLAGGLAIQLFSRERQRTERELPTLNATLHSLLLLSLCSLLCVCSQTASATSNPAEVREKAKVIERLGKTVDLSLQFRNAKGEVVRLSELEPKNRPLLIAPVYYECPELCGLTQSGLAKMLNALELKLGEDFSLVSVSFDSRETPEFAERKAAAYRSLLSELSEEQRASWHFLVGDEAQIRKLTEDIGFYYAEDGEDFIHAAIVAVLTPGGVISRYLYGIQFPEKQVRLAVIEASEGKVGSVFQRALMFCFRYDHLQGQYTLAIWKMIRVFCISFFLVLATCLVWLRVKEKGRPGRGVVEP